ncbi:MAG: hypothetical protein ABSD99_00105 [Candidatus Bathyarchaeia archaeon]
MNFTLSFKAFAHDVNNPPSMQSSCDVTLDVVNTRGVLQFSKEAVGAQTEYKVLVQDPSSIGITSDEQEIVNRVSQDLVLGCNIILGRVALSIFRLDLAKPNVMVIASPSQVVVKDTPTGKSIEISEEGHVRDEVHLTIGTREALDESRVVQVCNKLVTFRRFVIDASSSLPRANLINALHEYEAAMASVDRLLTFKHLYNVLELITNIDGTNREGFSLDNQMASDSGTPVTECEDWRILYNRTKHIHRSSTDVATFVTGLEKLTTYIPVMRQASGKKLATLL